VSLVSVIIPNYNHAPFLKQRIESVLNQTFQDFELIILDDYSTDNSREVIEQYRDHSKVKTIIFNDSNSGSPFIQWKKGISLASGEYIWIAESDDSVDVDFLERLLKFDSDFIFSKIEGMNDKNEILPSDNSWIGIFDTLDWAKNFKMDGIHFFSYLKERCIIPNVSSLIFKKKYFNTYSDSIVGMKFCGDWLFYLICATNGASFQYVCNTTSYFRHHTHTTRWLNKDFINPLRERFVCLEYVKKISKSNPIIENDLMQYIAQISINQLIQFSKSNFAYFLLNNMIFFKAFILKFKRRIKVLDHQ